MLEKQPSSVWLRNLSIAHMWERATRLTFVLPLVTGFSIGLHSDHSHHHVLCSHIYGWHSPHGHLVLLDKGKQKALLQWNVENKEIKNLFTEHELFCLSLFFHFQLYKIRPKRTRPQALLFLCMILLLIVLHTSYMIYSLASQYVMYGSQKYLVQVGPRRPKHANHSGGGSTLSVGSGVCLLCFHTLAPLLFFPTPVHLH